MKSEPKAPGAHAVILYRQVDRDDTGHTTHEDNYYRIKILTEEGRDRANVEIPFDKDNVNVVNIHGRTIRPDGSIASFDGKVYEKTVLKAKGIKVLVKAFTLPDVQVGGIIEYYFTYDFIENTLFNSHWILSDELFTRNAKFSLRPYLDNDWTVRWSWQGLPAAAKPVEGGDHVIRMEASNIPAFQTEDYMPPEDEMKSRVDFIYDQGLVEREPDRYWRGVGKKRNGWLEGFIGKHKAMEDAVNQIVLPTDAPEVKLRKIYDRVQQLRNTSYELEKSEQEEKRSKEKAPDNVEDVWKRGYANGAQLTWLYLAMVRAAGFEAYGCWVSARNEYFFNSQTQQEQKLNANVVLVKLNGKEMFFDPGAAFTPFGLLSWEESGTPGLRLAKDGGDWIRTPLAPASASQILRRAKLKVTETGGLEGSLTVSFTGLEGMVRRREEMHADDEARKSYLQEWVKEQIPAAVDVELINKPDWKSSEDPLVAEFDLKLPGWISSAGKRALMPMNLFAANEQHVFEHTNRVYPIYFRYPHEKIDDITIDLPLGWQISNIPAPQTQDGHVVFYSMKAENDHGTVHLQRTMRIEFMILEPKFYAPLRNFYQVVRTGDDEQVLLQPGT